MQYAAQMAPQKTRISRINELRNLKRFISRKGSGLTFLRGRRRVGKTWLLKDLQLCTPNCFYFMGMEDADDNATRSSFAEAWQAFSNEVALLELAPEYRTWARIFKQLHAFADRSPDISLVILLDEVQWIAKKHSGFISQLKQAWVDWQRLGNIKVIICGSSNKFFAKRSSGSDDILRGMKTSASIWVNELTLGEVERHYLKGWSRSEICLTYMMVGGSPYYLETIEPEKGFIHAINDAIFTSDSIFLDEVDQVLKLEFNSTGLATAKRILAALGSNGTTFSTIALNTKIPASTLSHALDNLVEYEILFVREDCSAEGSAPNRSPRYYLRDFYLNFYFRVLAKFSNIIRSNIDQLIFTSKAFLQDSGYYMPNFSGQAFELLCERTLLRPELKIPLKEKLMLKSLDYRVRDYCGTRCQIDLIVEDNADRIARIIECKWIDSNAKFSEHLKQLEAKIYPNPENFTVMHYLLPGYKVGKQQLDQAGRSKVHVLALNDLFD